MSPNFFAMFGTAFPNFLLLAHFFHSKHSHIFTCLFLQFLRGDWCPFSLLVFFSFLLSPSCGWSSRCIYPIFVWKFFSTFLASSYLPFLLISSLEKILLVLKGTYTKYCSLAKPPIASTIFSRYSLQFSFSKISNMVMISQRILSSNFFLCSKMFVILSLSEIRHFLSSSSCCLSLSSHSSSSNIPHISHVLSISCCTSIF